MNEKNKQNRKGIEQIYKAKRFHSFGFPAAYWAAFLLFSPSPAWYYFGKKGGEL
ncbi:MAG: hypothetical protein ACK5L3_08700 [Oscillospiraceae bacterium]